MHLRTGISALLIVLAFAGALPGCAGVVATSPGSYEKKLLTAAAGAELSGRVINSHRDPVAGARVMLLAERHEFFYPLGIRKGIDFNRLYREWTLGRSRLPRGGVVAETVTGDDGKYTFPVASLPVASYEMYAGHGDYVSESAKFRWAPQSRVIDFTLAPGEVVTGLVLDPEGAPVPGATIEAFMQRCGGSGPFEQAFPFGPRTNTDADGRFRFTVPLGCYRLRAAADGFSPGHVLNVATGTGEVTISLKPSLILAGLVKAVDGTPLPGVSVALHMRNKEWRDESLVGALGISAGCGGDTNGVAESITSLPVPLRLLRSTPMSVEQTDETGAFLFEAVPRDERLLRDEFFLVAEKGGFAPTLTIVNLSTLEEDELLKNRRRSVEIVLGRGIRLSGIVRDHEGMPVAGAFVAVAPTSSRVFSAFEKKRGDHLASYLSLLDTAETDSGGRFSFPPLLKDFYLLSIQSNRHPLYQLDRLLLDRERELDIMLKEGQTLRGKVVSGLDGTPVANASLTVSSNYSMHRESRRMVRTTGNGAFAITGLPPGGAGITIHAPGWATGYYRVPKVGSEERVFEIEPAAGIRGQVVDSDGLPVTGAKLRLHPVPGSDPPPPGYRRFRRSVGGESPTASDGRFHLSDIIGGRSYRIAVDHPGYRRLELGEVRVGRGETVGGHRLVLEEREKGEAGIAVLVRDPEGNPLPGVHVSGNWAGSDAVSWEYMSARGFDGFTGQDGKILFPALVPGDYAIYCNAAGGRFPVIRAVAGEGKVTEVVAELTADLLPEEGITGRVLSSLSGRPVVYALVVATNKSERRETRSGLDGSFRLRRFESAGEYTLSAGEAFGFSRSKRKHVAGKSDVEITLDPIGSLVGQVRTAGTGLPVTAFRMFVRQTYGRKGNDNGNTGAPGKKERQPVGSFREGIAPALNPRGRDPYNLPHMRAGWYSFLNPDGFFHFGSIERGTYELEVVAEGFRGKSVTVEVRSCTTTEGVVIDLEEDL